MKSLSDKYYRETQEEWEKRIEVKEYTDLQELNDEEKRYDKKGE